MIRRQTLIALGIALVLGLVAVYLANSFLTRSERDRDAQATVRVAVAAVPLDYGTTLTPERVKFIDYPATSLPPGTYRNIGQLLPAGKKRVALRPMAINEPILASKISVEGAGASMAALLPEGMRAATVRINDVSGVAGFVQPNDSVDVLITRNLNGEQVTDVLMQNVKVLAMGQSARERDRAQVSKSTTLQVDPLDAQKLALGEAVGSLSLVLRKPGEDENSPVVQTVSIDDLRYGRFSGRAYVQSSNAAAATPRPAATPARARRVVVRPAAPRVVAPPRPRTNSVEVVRGTQNSNYEVGGYGS